MAAPAALRALDLLLETQRRRLTRRRLLRRLTVVLGAALPLPLAAVVADHAWPGGLPGWLIGGGALVWAPGLGLALGGAMALTLLRRLDRAFVARTLERSLGLRHNALLNAVLVRRDARLRYAADGALRQALASLGAPRERPPALPAGRSGAGWVLAGVAAAWAIYAALAPKPVWPSLARFFGADLMAPTATWIELLRPGADQVVHAGEPLEIELAIRGRPVATVRFELLDAERPAGHVLASYRLSPQRVGKQDRRTLTLAPHEVSGDLHFRCRAGDALLVGVIPVRPQPDVTALRIHLVPPAYTGEPAGPAPDPELRVWPGTAARFELQANVALRDPVFVFRGAEETRTRMEVDRTDPRLAGLGTTLSRSGTYRIEFTDAWGYPCRDPVEHRVVVRQDQPPTVQIVQPAPEASAQTAAVTRLKELRAVASDDVGLDRLGLVQERDGGESRLELGGGAPFRPPPRRLAARVRTAQLGIAPGQTVRVWFEARDNRVLPDGSPAPQLARSRVLTLTRPAGPVQRASDAGTPASAPAAGRAHRGARQGDQPDSRPAAAADETPAPQTAPAKSASDNPARGGDVRAQDRGGSAQRRAAGQRPSSPVEAGPQRQPDGTGGRAPEASPSPSRAARQAFEREARRFQRQHGRETREVRTKLAQRDAARQDGQADGPREAAPGGSGAGATRPAGDGSRAGTARRTPVAGRPGRDAQQAALPAGTARQTRAADERAEKQPARSAGSGEARGAAPPNPGKAHRLRGADQRAPQEAGRASSPSGAAPGRAGTSNGQLGQQPGGRQSGADGAAGAAGAGGGPATPQAWSAPGPGESLPPGREGAAARAAGQPVAQQSGPQRAELMDLLEMAARGQIARQMLTRQLGWTEAKAASFLKALERLYGSAQRAGLVGPQRQVRASWQAGTATLQRGSAAAGDISTTVGGAGALADALASIAPPPEQRVPPRLEPLLEAYYRALAERAARPASQRQQR